MKVAVTGGRSFSSRHLVYSTLDALHAVCPIDMLIHGGARGADRLADDWARANGVKVESYEADWKRHGKAAGPLRNRDMLERGQPNLVVAFPGGPGTADCVRRARSLGIEVVEVQV